MEYLYFILLALVVLIFIFKVLYRKVIVLEYEKALLYKKGKSIKTLEAGRYWIRSDDTIMKIDVRDNYEVVPNQEVLTADGASVKLTLVAVYNISDTNIAINKVQSYQQALYATLQSAVREAIAKQNIDDFLEKRDQFNKDLMQSTKEKAKQLGLELKEVLIRDVMLVGELKKALTQIVAARKEGMAKLERARGESSALRNLANAAKMIDDNPNLLQLRILDSLSQNTGNTIVFGTGENLAALKKTKK